MGTFSDHVPGSVWSHLRVLRFDGYGVFLHFTAPMVCLFMTYNYDDAIFTSVAAGYPTLAIKLLTQRDKGLISKATEQTLDFIAQLRLLSLQYFTLGCGYDCGCELQSLPCSWPPRPLPSLTAKSIKSTLIINSSYAAKQALSLGIPDSYALSKFSFDSVTNWLYWI